MWINISDLVPRYTESKIPLHESNLGKASWVLKEQEPEVSYMYNDSCQGIVD